MRNEGPKRSLLRKIQDYIRHFLRKETPPEGDPYAYVTSPLRRGPKGRSGAAVAEIEDDSFESFPPRRS
jgi:hypothetical protein